MDEAIAWHLGLEEAGAEEWRRFVAWLEADPRHADAYDRLTADDALFEQFAPVPALPRRAPSVRVRQWARPVRWGGGAMAAAAAIAAVWLAVVPAAAPGSELYSIVTKPGMRHDVTLADGTRIEMNGDTAITLDRKQPRRAVLDRGEAMFSVVHHADRPFEVRVAGVTLRDVGTRFDVVRQPGTLGVAVAEGSVLYQPEREAVSLTKGMALAARDGQDRIELRRTDAEAVGGWTRDRLDYRDAALATVAADVERAIGVPVRVAPGFAARPFTGTLRTDRAPEAVVRSLASLAGGSARRDGRGWTIAATSAGAS